MACEKTHTTHITCTHTHTCLLSIFLITWPQAIFSASSPGTHQVTPWSDKSTFLHLCPCFLPFSSSCSDASKFGPGSCSFIKIEYTWPKWNIPLIWHVSWKLFHCYFITRFPTVMTANNGNPSFTVLQTLLSAQVSSLHVSEAPGSWQSLWPPEVAKTKSTLACDTSRAFWGTNLFSYPYNFYISRVKNRISKIC